jgi:hypothetical protein
VTRDSAREPWTASCASCDPDHTEIRRRRAGQGAGQGLGKVPEHGAASCRSLRCSLPPWLLRPVPPRRPGLPRPETSACTRVASSGLNAEWGALVRDPPLRRRQPAGHAHPRWPGTATRGRRRRRSERGRDDVLRALLGSPGTATRSRRVALQAMLGAAVPLARRTVAHRGGDHEESSRGPSPRSGRSCASTVRATHCRPVDGISLDVLALLTGADGPRSWRCPRSSAPNSPAATRRSRTTTRSASVVLLGLGHPWAACVLRRAAGPAARLGGAPARGDASAGHPAAPPALARVPGRRSPAATSPTSSGSGTRRCASARRRATRRLAGAVAELAAASRAPAAWPPDPRWGSCS